MRQIEEAVQCGDSSSAQSLALTLAQRMPGLCTRGVVLAHVEPSPRAGWVVEATQAQRVNDISMNLPFGFVFTGQGSQYSEAGKALLQNNDSFRETIRQLDAVLRSLPVDTRPSWTMEQTLLDPPECSKISLVSRSQPVCTAIQIGLVRLLREWGISPSSVVGHSSGEIAAAYAAGFLNSTEAVLAAYFRGFAVEKLVARGGAMVAAGMGPEAAEQLLLELGLQDKVCIACINSPSSVTFSGLRDAAESLLEALRYRQLFHRLLNTDGRAYHSHLVKIAGKTYEDLLGPRIDQHVGPRSKAIKMFSTVQYGTTGQSVLLSAEEARKAKYWTDNLEGSVQFDRALQELMEDGKGCHLIEIGPHPTLRGPVQQIRTAAQVDESLYPYSMTLTRDQDSELAMKRLSGSLYQYGYDLQWNRINDLDTENLAVLHNLKPYPWDYSAGLHWHEPRQSVDLRNRKHRRHELLGSAQLVGNGIDWSWRNVLQLGEVAWLSDHKVETQAVFPATGYLAIAMEALTQIHGAAEQRPDGAFFHFRDVAISSALVVPGGDGMSYEAAKDTEIHTTMCAKKISSTSTSSDWLEFSISSWSTGRATLHCSGNVRLVLAKPTAPTHEVYTDVQDAAHFDKWTSMRPWYEKLADEGLCFGPAFQSLTSLMTDPSSVRTDAVSSTTIKTQAGTATDTIYPVHPISLDACLQAAIMGGTSGNLEVLRAFIPVSITECKVWPQIERCNKEGIVHTRFTTTGFATKRVDCTLFDAAKNPIVDMKSVLLSLYTGKIVRNDDAACSSPYQRHPSLRIHWKPDILRLRPAAHQQLGRYIDDGIAQLRREANEMEDNSKFVSSFGAVLDLVGHSRPDLRVLEVLSAGQPTSKGQWLRLLGKETAFPRIRSWNTAKLSDDGTIVIDSGNSGPFDALVLDQLPDSNTFWETQPGRVLPLLSSTGVIIASKTDASLEGLARGPFTVVEVAKDVIVRVRQSKVTEPIKDKEILLVVCYTFSLPRKSFGIYQASSNSPYIVQDPFTDIKRLCGCSFHTPIQHRSNKGYRHVP